MSRIHCSQCGQAGHNRRNRMCPVNVQQRTTSQVDTPHTPLQSFIRQLYSRVEDNTNLFIINMYHESDIAVFRSLESPDIRKRCEDYMMQSLQELYNMVQYTTQESIHPSTDRNTFINNFTAMCFTFCSKINTLFVFDVNERLDATRLYDYFGASVRIFNDLARRLYGNLQTRIIPSIHNRRITFMEIHIPLEIPTVFSLRNSFVVSPENLPIPMLVPRSIIAPTRTSAYLKDISLVHDINNTDTTTSCDCPLCFESITAADSIVTNCNHSFCGLCINGYATAIKNNTKKPNCPMCRTDLTTFTIGNQQVYEETREHIANL